MFSADATGMIGIYFMTLMNQAQEPPYLPSQIQRNSGGKRNTLL